MNEKRIQEVIDIERRAKEMLAAAEREAESLPGLAEAEGQELILKARKAAEEEARLIVERASAEEETAATMRAVEDKIREIQQLATANLERAVEHVLDRVIGKA